MERFVRITAPISKIDFAFKLGVLILICGVFNHLRDVLTAGDDGFRSYLHNTTDAAWTALPMCSFALLLIGHLNNLQKRLYRQATTDALTQLPNRRYFMDRMSKEATERNALIMLDVDHFKRLNDTYGHEAGDVCLNLIAQHLGRTIRPRDACARFGGEEFAILLCHPDDATIDQIAKELVHGIVFHPTPESSERVTMSAGVAFTGSGKTVLEVLQEADVALYHAKAAGRARYEIASKAPRKDQTADVDTVTLLHRRVLRG